MRTSSVAAVAMETQLAGGILVQWEERKYHLTSEDIQTSEEGTTSNSRVGGPRRVLAMATRTKLLPFWDLWRSGTRTEPAETVAAATASC